VSNNQQTKQTKNEKKIKIKMGSTLRRRGTEDERHKRGKKVKEKGGSTAQRLGSIK
jgi:hypothetical protein